MSSRRRRPVRAGGRYVHGVQQGVSNWNLLHAAGNVLETGMIVQLMAPSAYVAQPDLEHRWNRDLLREEPALVCEDPQTIVYRIRPEASWNDGTPLTAADFRYTWQVQSPSQCPACTPTTHAGYEAIRSVTGSEDGRTVTVTLRDGTAFPDWEAMFSYLYPAHVAARAGDLDTPEGRFRAFQSFNDVPPTWSGGPYLVGAVEPGVSVTLVPNPRWYGQVRPSLDEVVFRVLPGPDRLLAALRDGRLDGINPQPTPELVAGVAELPGVRHGLSTGLVWEHLDLNLRRPHLADRALRRAIFTAIDREEVLDATVRRLEPGSRTLDSHNFVPGQPAYRDVVSATGQGRADVSAARRILDDAGYRRADDGLHAPGGELVPPLRFRYAEGVVLRRTAGELVAAQLGRIGLRVDLEPTDQLGVVLDAGDFDLAVYAWVGNPVRVGPARDMWTTGGGMNYGGYSNPEVDALIAAANNTLDLVKAHELLNRADELLSADAYVLPLFQKLTFLAVRDRMANVVDNPTNGALTFNAEEWGLSDAGD